MGNSILDSVKEGVTDLHNAGLVDDVTMKNIESLCIPEVKEYDARNYLLLLTGKAWLG